MLSFVLYEKGTFYDSARILFFMYLITKKIIMATATLIRELIRIFSEIRIAACLSI